MYNYPESKEQEQIITFGTNTVIDKFEWLRDSTNKEVIEYTKKQNDFTDDYFEKHIETYNHNYQIMKEHSNIYTYIDAEQYFGDIIATKQYKNGNREIVILDKQLNTIKVLENINNIKGMQIISAIPNPTQKDTCILFVLKDKEERTSGIVYQIENNKIIAELPLTFSIAWSNDGRYAYYCTAKHRQDGTIENTLRQYDITDNTDTEIYTYSGHAAYGMVEVMDNNGVYVKFAVDYQSSYDIILENQKIYEIGYDGYKRAYVGQIKDKYIFLTDKDAPMGKLVIVDKNYDFKNTSTYIKEREEQLEEAYFNNGKIICIYSHIASNTICVYDENKDPHFIKLPCEYGTVTLNNREIKNNKPLINYSSFNIPTCILELNIENYEANLLNKNQEQNPKSVDVKLLKIKAQDNTDIMAYVVHKKELKITGDNKALIYGYGGYNAINNILDEAADFDIRQWIENDGIYIHAIIRGGGEFGENWHKGGWKENKINCFNDFCDIAEEIIKRGYTNPNRLAAYGISNGGLLMTAIATRRPELFKCIIASVPHTDMLGFCYDDRGPMYITEYGDPRDPKMFEYLKSYSPYHNIKKDTKYPSMYIQTGEMDNNVPSYHAKKFATKMQKLQNKQPILLRTLPFGSHDRGKGEWFIKTLSEINTFIEIELDKNY